MKLPKIVTAALFAGALMIPTALAVPAADAASNQRICNADDSEAEFDISVLPAGTNVPMPVDRCESVFPRGKTIVTMYTSYRVKYVVNGKKSSYSACRHNSGFTPYSKADKIVFKTYDNYNC